MSQRHSENTGPSSVVPQEETLTDPTATIPRTMRAVAVGGSHQSGDAGGDRIQLTDVELPVPAPRDHDLLVEVQATSINPIDVKVRRRTGAQPGGEPRILGFDAVGVVRAAGPRTERFQPGDHVFYAGDITRPGANAQYQLVDERIVGRKPAELSATDAAALPLTAITAWECLFERLGASIDTNGSILVLGGSGGVPSVLVQLARALTGLNIVATASREESEDWVLEMGAHEVVNHARDLRDQVLEIEPQGVDYVFSSWTTGREKELAEVMAPQAQMVLIDDPEGMDMAAFKSKSITVHWESMFTRSMFATPDMEEQGLILDRVADMVDDGRLSTTANEELHGLSAETLTEAHRLVEHGRLTGKTVIGY